jgi:hypothetical protein
MFIKHPLTWVVLALLGMFTIAGMVGDTSRTERPLSGAQAPKKAGDAKDKQGSASAPSEAPPTIDAKKQPREYEPDCSKSEHADLCAQRRMAKAAEEQTGLNLIGLGLLFFTLCATIAAALYAGQAAGAAHKTVQVMEVTAKRQLRAYVNYNGGSVINFDGASPLVQVVIRNFGQTPAYNVRTRINIWVTPTPLTTPFRDLDADITQRGGVLGPQSHFVLGRALVDRPLTPTVKSEIRNDSRGLFVFGDINYVDAFGENQLTTFRLVYGGGEEIHPEGNLATCEEGNEAT